MNEEMNGFIIDNNKAKRLFTLTLLLLCLLPILLDTIVITPLYVNLENDVAFSSSFLPTTVYYCREIIELLSFLVAYSIIIFAMFFTSKAQVKAVMLFYTLVHIAKIPLKLVMNIFIYGSLGSVEEIMIDLIYLTVYFLLDMLQLLSVYLFTARESNRYFKHIAFMTVKCKKRNAEHAKVNYPTITLNISKFYSKYNPLQRSALKMSILILAIKLLSRLLNDIAYGLPISFGEVMVMLLYYLSDILYGLAAYVTALLLFSCFYEKLNYKKTDEAIASSDNAI